MYVGSVIVAGAIVMAVCLPHVDISVTTSNPLESNDRLVPVPVLSVKWAIVLCAVLFHIGARVLRVRRSTTA